MNREPEHLAADPSLREEFIAQPSLDEYAERNAAWLKKCFVRDPTNLETVRPIWKRTLRLDTSPAEELYLEGFTDKEARDAELASRQDKLDHYLVQEGWYESLEELEKSRGKEPV